MRPKVVPLIIEIVLLLLIPLYLMMFVPHMLAIRHIFFVLGITYVLVRAFTDRVRWSDWGITTRQLLPALGRLLPLTFLLPFLTLVLIAVIPEPTRLWLVGVDTLHASLGTRLLFYNLGSVPIQELIFRSYLFWRLTKLGYSARSTVLCSILLFAVGHIPFRSPVMLVVSTILGVSYAFNYQKYHNVIALILSHAIVGSLLLIGINYFYPY